MAPGSTWVNRSTAGPEAPQAGLQCPASPASAASWVPQSARGRGSSLISPKTKPLHPSLGDSPTICPSPLSGDSWTYLSLNPHPVHRLVSRLPRLDCVPGPAFLTSSAWPATRVSYTDVYALLPLRRPQPARGALSVSVTVAPLKSSPLPMGSPSRRGMAHFMFHPLPGVRPLTPSCSLLRA